LLALGGEEYSYPHAYRTEDNSNNRWSAQINQKLVLPIALYIGA